MPGGFKLATAFVDVQAQATGLDRSITSKVKTASEKAGTEGGKGLGAKLKSGLNSPLAQIGGTIAGAFAVNKIADFFGDSIAEARESQKVNAQTAAVIKSTGDASGLTATQFGTLATKISNKTGIDDEQIQSSENMLATFTNVRDEVGKGNDIFSQATQVVTDMSAATGQDGVKSSVLLGKALNDPIKGISALTRVGVTFTDQQKKSIKAMVDSGNTAGAQKVIIGELNKEFGGSAAAQATSGDKMKTTWKNLEEQIGTMLIPVIDKLERFISEKLLPAIMTMAVWLQDHVVPILKAVGHWISQNTSWLIPLIGVVVAMVAAFKIATAVMAVFNLVMDANPIVLVVVAIVALVAGVILAYNKVGWFRDLVNTAFHVIASVGQWLWNTILHPVFEAIKIQIAVTVAVIRTQISIWQAIFRAAAAIVSWLWNSIIKPVFNAIKVFITATVAGIRAVINTLIAIWRGLGTVASTVFGGIKRAVAWIGQAFSDAYHAVTGWIGHIVSAVTGLPGKIAGIAGKMLTAGSKIMSSLFDGIKGILKGGGKLAADIGKDIINGIIDGLNAVLPHHLSLHFKVPVIGKKVGFDIPLIPNIPHLATGGIITSPGDVLLGEEGAEVVRLPVGAAVFPTGTRPGGGGDTYYVTFQVSMDEVGEVQKLLDTLHGLPVAVRAAGVAA